MSISAENPVNIADAVVVLGDGDGDDDDNSVDQEQLDDYRRMLEELGPVAEKVAINSLSMVAGDFADSLVSATALYNVIRQRLLSTSRDNILPIVYVIDSILKNVRGKFISIIQHDAQDWMPLVYNKLSPPLQAKLERVFNTWQDTNLFPPETLRIIGRCFSLNRTSSHKTSSGNSNPLAATRVVAGIPMTADGSLVLATHLRRAMQAVLDEMQSGTEDELNKVSLERLAELNPDLIATIKATAKENMAAAAAAAAQNNQGGNGHGNGHTSHMQSATLPSFLQYDSRSPTARQLEQDWAQLAWDHSKATSVIDKLRFQSDMDVDVLYTQQEAVQMTSYFGVAHALSTVLQATMEGVMQNEASRKLLQQQQGSRSAQASAHPRAMGPSYHGYVDKSLFTNAGIKERNGLAVGYLYHIGLPFPSSADGRRFATQKELSSHLDALFKRNQLEKTMARTEERGWTLAESMWMRLVSETSANSQLAASTNVDASGSATEQRDDVFPADDTRDSCVICGNAFKMIVDQDQGVYMYSNCCEKAVENDEAAEEETSLVLVHKTCWKGLGSPEIMSMDQALPTNRE